MPPALVANVAQVVSRFGIGVGSERAHMVWHWYRALGWSTANLEVLGTAVNDIVVAELMPFLASAASYEGCTVQDIGTDGGVPVDRSITPVFGTIVENINPPQVALVISWRTNNSSRNGRGRSYIGGIPRTVLSDASHVNQAFVDNMQDFATKLRGISMLNTANMVIVSRVRNKLPRTPPVTYPVQLNSVNSRLDTQRRRLPRV